MWRNKNFINFLFCLFLICSCDSFGQVLPQSGEVIYSIKTNPSSAFKNAQRPVEFQKIQNKINATIPNLKFNLTFNKNYSLFSIISNLNIDDKGFLNDMAILSTRGNSIFFTDIDEKMILEQTSFLGEDILIQSSISDLKWKFINEQKQIGEYICYKAQALKENSGPLKGKDKISIYTAWYCPDINFNFGPYEIVGLPGLVLEFSNDQLIYTASEIKFKKNIIKIKKPVKGTVLTKEQFQSMGEKTMENRSLIKN